MYESGQGVKQNYKKAVDYYQKAADQGNPLAQFNLGYFKEGGLGGEQDYNKATEYYQKAAVQESQAQLSLHNIPKYRWKQIKKKFF